MRLGVDARRRPLAWAGITAAAALLAAAGCGGGSGGPAVGPPPVTVADADAGEALFRRNCSGCHTFGHGDHLGPDLSVRNPSANWVRNFIADPASWIGTGYGQRLRDAWGYTMPDYGLSAAEIDDLIAFFERQDGRGPLAPSAPVALDAGAFEQARQTYFDRCAGCHGLVRSGATGPDIGQVRSTWIGTDGLAALMRHGTPRGMPNFGTSGTLGESQIAQLAAYLQQPPPEPPALPMSAIQASWRLTVPVGARPTAPQHARDWRNFFGVVERDASKVSIFDGASRELVARLDVGFAVHILRSSASGRYFQAIGRDGLVSLIDLWAAVPGVVASVKGCHDARSVEGSRMAGHEDRFLVEGCYWPPQYVVYDGQTLEPLARVDLPLDSIDGATLPEVRVASIFGLRDQPLWALALKESGWLALVDYTQPGFPIVQRIAGERFLHDGGWDAAGRHLLIAANASRRMVAFDMQRRELAASFETGDTPHPGRGANWLDPQYGWVNVTPHLGEPKVSIYGADPVGRPDVAWKVVRELTLPAAGSLFVKTHPNSPWVLFDMTMSTTHARQVCAYAKASGKIDRCFDVARAGKAVHFEFDRDGKQVWVSDWASDGAVVVLDAVTLQEVARIGGLVSPTGKFNVHNTAEEVY